MLTDRELEGLAAALIGEFTGRVTEHKDSRRDVIDWLCSDGGLFPPVDSEIIETTLKTPKSPADVVEVVTWYTRRIEELEQEIATESYSRQTRYWAKNIVTTKNLAVDLPPSEWFTEPGHTLPARYDAELDELVTSDDEPMTPDEEEAELVAWYQPAPPEFNRVCLTLLQAQVDAYRHELEKVQGKRGTPLQSKIAARIEAAKPKPRLSELWESYRAAKMTRGKWTEGTAERLDGLFAQITDILGDCDLSDLEDEAKAVYLTAMLQKYPAGKEKSAAFAGKRFSPAMAKHQDFKPLSITSINKCIELMSSVVKFAIENRKKWGMDYNAFARAQLTDTRPVSELREAYNTADIRGLIEALKEERPRWEPENYWIPLLALFTGARQNELCQLRTEDVQEADGVAYIEIRHRPELNQTTKTRKDRTVPIHSTLIALGFLDYCRGQQHERLWPNLKLLKGKWQHEFSKRYNRTVRARIEKAGGRSGKDFHGLRHTFLDRFKQSLALSFDNAKVLKSLAGHLDRFDVSIVGAIQEDITFDRYGKAYKLQKQQELIERLDYGIDFMELSATAKR